MISVCLLTYNGEKYVKTQLLSILEQLSKDDEVIVSDDNSFDNTLEIIKQLNDSRIKVFHNHISHNSYSGTFARVYRISRNCENALKYAMGDYVFLSDQDDIWYHDKIKVMLAYLKNANLVIHNCSIIDANGVIIGDDYFHGEIPQANLWQLLVKSPFMGCCMGFTKQLKDSLLPFPHDLIEHDAWIGIRALLSSQNPKFITNCLVYYRRHGNNASYCGEKSSNPISVKIKRRLIILQVYINELVRGLLHPNFR